MNEEKRDALTADEVAALRYCDDRGLALPDWLTREGEKYYRPHRFTREQFEDYAARLNMYNQYASSKSLAVVKGWVTVLGVLTILGIIFNLIF